MRYIDLVNKAIQESAQEIDELTDTTWDSYTAGRRIYPRIKRYVSEAWKKIQLSRDTWEFVSLKYNGTVNPQLRYSNGDGSIPLVGDIFVGDESGLNVKVKSITVEEGDWTLGTAAGVLVFEYVDSASNAVYGETFTNDDTGATFLFIEPAAYDFSLSATDLATLQWTTMVGSQEGITNSPITFIPWDNWFYRSLDFAHGTRSIPQFVSQDPTGKAVFYPASLEPFDISFIYTKTPQVLTEWDDEVIGLPEYLQDWIAWEAVKMVASYDKNGSLYAHAKENANFYKNRADKNLMPLVSFAGSRFNE